MENQIETDNRELVLHVAAQVATDCVKKVKEAGLFDGHLQETVNVKSVDWHIHAIYETEDDEVRVFGHRLEHDEDDPEDAGVRVMINPITGQHAFAHEPEFDFTCPSSWIPGVGEEA